MKLAIWIALATVPAAVLGQAIPLDDRLPASHWSMDGLSYLASSLEVAGVPARIFSGGVFAENLQPERRFSRGEVAEIVLRIVAEAADKDLTARQRLWLAALEREFAAELRERAELSGQAYRPSAQVVQGFAAAGYRRNRVSWLSGDAVTENGAVLTSRGVLRASGIYLTPRLQAFATLSTERRRSFGAVRDGRILDKLFVNWQVGSYNLSVGRDYLYWGPAYSGSLILSDAGPALDQIRVQRDFSLGKALGKINIQEFVATWREGNGSARDRVYLYGRRYEKQLSKSWQFGTSEIAKSSTPQNPLIAVLPFYLYQKLFINVDSEFNVIHSLDLKHTFESRGEAYLDLVVDDWRAPGFLGGAPHTVRKAGLLVGGAVFSKREPLPDSLRIEFFTIDPHTYTASREAYPLLAYGRGAYPIGYPIGRNVKGFCLRGDKWLTERLEVIGEFVETWPRDEAVNTLSRRRVVSLAAAHDLSPRTAVTLRCGWVWENPPSASERRGTVVELGLRRTL